jgi:hypothetical protein
VAQGLTRSWPARRRSRSFTRSARSWSPRSRAGYTRDKFRRWNTGLDSADGCRTRAEDLLAEATEAPSVATGSKIGEGEWLSYYDAGASRAAAESQAAVSPWGV